METTERVQVAEPAIFSSSDKFRDKFMPGYWKNKEVDGVSSFIKMDDMTVEDKLRALKVAEKQAAKYAKLQEIHTTKYEELLISLESINNIDEDKALEAIKTVKVNK